MKTKNTLIFGMAFIFIILILTSLSTASSCPSTCTINTFLKYENNISATSMTVTQGENVNLVLIAYSHGEKLSSEKLNLNSTLILEENQEGVEQTSLSYLYNKVYTLNTGILIPGSYTLKFTAISKSGLKDSSTLKIVILKKIVYDKTPPIVKISSPVNWIYNNKVTSMTAWITDDNLNKCWYNLGNGNVSFSCYNGPNTINSISSTEGKNVWKIYAEDTSGNFGSDEVTFTVKSKTILDTTPPTIDIEYPEEKDYSEYRTSLTFDVYDLHLKSCSYSTDGVNFEKIDSVYNGLNIINGLTSTKGENTWIVKCEDYSGNIGEKSTIFTINIPKSTTPPIVKISSPVNWIYNNKVTSMTAWITDDNLNKCWYNLGNGNVSFSCHNGPNTINSISSTEGKNVWKIYAEDTSGNVGSDEVTFTVINNPTTSLKIISTTPIENQIVKKNTTFEIIVNQNSTASYSLDGSANVTMNELSPLNFYSNVFNLKEGDHNVLFCARNSLETVCKSISFKVKFKTNTENESSCNSSKHNGPLSEKNLENKKNLPGNPPTEEVLYLKIKNKKLNFFQEILLWIENLFR